MGLRCAAFCLLLDRGGPLPLFPRLGGTLLGPCPGLAIAHTVCYMYSLRYGTRVDETDSSLTKFIVNNINIYVFK
jgi:hypothetical protein